MTTEFKHAYRALGAAMTAARSGIPALAVSVAIDMDEAEGLVPFPSTRAAFAPAAALVVAGKAAELKEGVAIASESIDSGRAKAKIEALALATQAVADRPR